MNVRPTHKLKLGPGFIMQKSDYKKTKMIKVHCFAECQPDESF